MLRALLLAAVSVLAISLPGGAAGSSTATDLTGVVGPGTFIALWDGDGNPVQHLVPGSYRVMVSDQDVLHNFHLFGPGVDRATDVEGVGQVVWDVTFTDGTYTYRCDAHPTTMRITFTVGSAPPPPTPPQKLNGKVSSRAISLNTRSGARVTSLVENIFKVTVSDTSKTQNFHLIGPGVNRKTGVKARAKPTWTVKLVPGKYTYRSDKSRRLRRTFTVTAKVPPS